MGFVHLPYKGEEEWLLRRQRSITATDIAKIRTGSPKAFAALWREKHEPPRHFSNKFTEHGKDREPHIAAEVTEQYPGLLHNRHFLVKDDDPRFGATPDMVSEDGLTLGEIKTHFVSDESKLWLDLDDVWRKNPGYRAQVQWQLFITGAEKVVFVWEDWSDEDGWKDIRPLRFATVYPDHDMISGLVDLAEEFLAWSPPEIEQGDGADFEVMAIADRLAEIDMDLANARAVVRGLEGDRKAAQADLLEAVGDTPRSVDYGGFVVEVSPGRRSRSFDRKALAADYPELEEKYTLEKDGAPSVRVLEKASDHGGMENISEERGL